MHAVVAYNTSITRVLGYHQQKVEQGRAECIQSNNFIRDANELDQKEKEYHFQRLNQKNDRVMKNTPHVFLRFSPEETVGNETMGQVAKEWLEGMGFGEQPYLVYRHYDSAVPHAHLVTTNVDEEGNKIAITRAGLFYSRQLTHQLEEKYGLQQGHSMEPGKEEAESIVEPVRHGEEALSPAMNKVLEHVLPNYAYTSMDELNAVLGLYQMRAVQPKEDLHSRGQPGLYFQPLREDGQVINAFVTASTLLSQPTAAQLEERFVANLTKRASGRDQMTTAIDWSLFGTQLSAESFKEAMGYEGVSVVYRHNLQGAVQNVWFVDHNARTVFEGSTLGENYSAGGLSRRLISEEQYRQQQQNEREAERQQVRLHL